MYPWANLAKIADKKYPGHNQVNWWDFFFPGIVESWQKWADKPIKKGKIREDEITLTPMYDDAGGQGLMVTFFHPLWTKSRKQNYGAAAIDYHINNLIDITKKEKIGKNGFSFLVLDNGEVLGLDKKGEEILAINTQQKSESGVRQVKKICLTAEVRTLPISIYLKVKVI